MLLALFHKTCHRVHSYPALEGLLGPGRMKPQAFWKSRKGDEVNAVTTAENLSGAAEKQ